MFVPQKQIYILKTHMRKDRALAWLAIKKKKPTLKFS
jgi:hypothetical protein